MEKDQIEVPCENCIVFVMCKIAMFSERMDRIPNVLRLAQIQDCPYLMEYFGKGKSSVNRINQARALYGLEPIGQAKV